jgi:DNA-binding YbaB/EbfC family protein
MMGKMPKGFSNMMKQAQKLQRKIEEVQAALEEKKIEASSGGGMVTAVVNGRQDLEDLKIDPSVIDPDDVGFLEDLIVAAIRKAMDESRKMAEEEMNKATGGVLPDMGGLKI